MKRVELAEAPPAGRRRRKHRPRSRTTPPARSTRAELHVERSALEMVEGARDRRGHDLIGAGRPTAMAGGML